MRSIRSRPVATLDPRQDRLQLHAALAADEGVEFVDDDGVEIAEEPSGLASRAEPGSPRVIPGCISTTPDGRSRARFFAVAETSPCQRWSGTEQVSHRLSIPPELVVDQRLERGSPTEWRSRSPLAPLSPEGGVSSGKIAASVLPAAVLADTTASPPERDRRDRLLLDIAQPGPALLPDPPTYRFGEPIEIRHRLRASDR